MALEPGQIIDSKYRVVRRIGEGGMGTVYEGENTRIARRVAIKVLHAQVAALSDFVARFEREAKAVARIGSQHICDVLDLGDLPNGDRYIVMEFLDGVSFEDRLVERVKLTPAQLAPIAFELLEGLGMMHLAGVIHRDLKPANVFLAKASGGRGEMVKILDFGVAKLQPLTGEVGSMTQTGTMMGTPLYMSPEQARGARDVDGRTDIYAASVMFYRAIAGVLPHNAETLNELLFKIVLEDPKPLREVAPEVDEVFAAIVQKGLARELPHRFQNARTYQEELVAWGKTQGRSSLSFAVTHISDIPPATPITLAGPSREAAAVPAGTAVSSAVAGTPIAWSEACPGNGSAPQIAVATILTPISSSSQNNPHASLGGPGGPRVPSTTLTGDAAPSNTTLSSSGSAMSTSHSAKEEGVVVAHALTGPTQSPTEGAAAHPATTSAAVRSPRTLIAGTVAAGAVAVVAIITFGRGGQQTPPATGPTPIPSLSAGVGPPADSTTSSSAKTSAPATAEIAFPTVAKPPPSASALAAPTTATDPAVAARKDAATAATVRRIEPATKSSATTAPTTAASAPTMSVASPAAITASATAPKPAASARKFRTNLD